MGATGSTAVHQAILAAAKDLRVPGLGDTRILPTEALAAIAASLGEPRWEIEAQALDLEVIPLRLLRCLAPYSRAGLSRLLRSQVAFIGRGEPLAAAAERLAAAGLGRFLWLGSETDPGWGMIRQAAAQRSPSTACAILPFTPRSGESPREMHSVHCVLSCLEDQAEEQLLQFHCRRLRLHLVLGGADGARGQATLVPPGEAGAAILYRSRHPHLEPRRAGVPVGERTALMVGSWLAEQALAVLLDSGELLVNRLLYADLDEGRMEEHSMSGRSTG